MKSIDLPAFQINPLLAATIIILFAGCGKREPEPGAGGLPPSTEGNAAAKPAPEEGSQPASKSGPNTTSEPAQPPASNPQAEPVEVPTPATLSDLAASIDLTELDRLDVSHLYDERPHHLRYLSDTTAKAARDHYANLLGKAGWEVEQTVHQSDDDEYTTLAVGKDSYLVKAEFQKSNLAQDGGRIYIDLKNYGNVDPRLLPRPASADSPSDDRVDFSYVANSDIDAFALFMNNALQQRGWTPLDGALEFQAGAMLLTIQPVKLGERSYSVSYHVDVER